MADPTPASGGASGSQSQANVLGPGIVGLLIQGIQTGIIFSQLGKWLSLPGRTEHRFITVLTVFITTVGLVQTAIFFLSCWQIYVERNGEPVIPSWTERIQVILTVFTATPVQSLLLWRCYHILNRNLYFIIPLLLLLLGSVASAIFDTVGLFGGMFSGPNPNAIWSFLLYISFFSTLDIILSSVLFYYLTQSRKRVYAEHTVQWISRLIIIVWQSAIPPTVCVVGLFITYIITHRLYPGEAEMWFPTVQAMIGKLYVLSHFYNINIRPVVVGEQEQPSTAYVYSLTVPALHGPSSFALNAPEEHPSESYTDSLGRTNGTQS